MSEPPHASSWAAPPEFYVDENIAGRTLRRALEDLGYNVHTPPQLYGSREASEGVSDTQWLDDVGRAGWVVIGRDTKILERPDELAAYRAAGVHMFLFPGQATREQLVDLVRQHLRDICAYASSKDPRVCRVRRSGVTEL